MSPRNQAQECPKLVISNWLFVIVVSPLPRPPGYSASCSPNCPESRSGDCSAGYPERHLENYPDFCPVSYSEGCPERNRTSYPESSVENRSADSSADCPGKRPEDSSGSNLPSNPEDNLLRYSESYPADTLPGCLDGCHGRVDAAQAAGAAQRRSHRVAAAKAVRLKAGRAHGRAGPRPRLRCSVRTTGAIPGTVRGCTPGIPCLSNSGHR